MVKFEKEDLVAYRNTRARRYGDPRSGSRALVKSATTCFVTVEWVDPFEGQAPPAFYRFCPHEQTKFKHEKFILIERKAGPW